LLTKEDNIVIISTTCLEVPPTGYGGVEQVVYNLAEELVSRGYNITCVAPKGTEIEGANVIETVEPDDSTNCFAREPEAYEIYKDEIDQADVVLDHSWQKHSYIAKNEDIPPFGDIPVLGVWHGMPSIREKPPVEYPNYLSVSKSAATAWSEHTGLEVRHAYNGINLDNYGLRDNHYSEGDNVLTLNRIMPEKGIKEFVSMCHTNELEFIVAGENTFVDNPGYVHEIMAIVHNSDHGTYRGRVSHSEKVELLKNAKATVLMPIGNYKEVFGLAAVESMACGTPVICTDNNGLAEVASCHHQNKVTNSLEEMVEHLSELSSSASAMLDPSILRDIVTKSFSQSAMTDLYIQRMNEALESSW